jgi:plasmid maintenance system antidote protein VapI
MTDHQPFTPDWTLRPGILLRDFLRARGMSSAELSVRSGLYYPVVLAVLDGTASIDVGIAWGIGQATGTSAATWLNAQANYDADLERGATDVSGEHEGD